MIPAAIARESALSEPNVAFRGDSDRSWSPKEGIGEIPAREETETAIPGRYSDELLELPLIYSCIYPSDESIWVVSRTTGEHREIHHYTFYDVSKREFLPGWFSFALPFSCGLGAIRAGDWDSSGRSYFVDEDLRPAFDAEFDEVGRFSHGLAAVYQVNDAGYIDTTGRMRLVLAYEDLQPFDEFGLAIANRDQGEWPGRLGGLLPRGSHRSGLADFPHPACHVVVPALNRFRRPDGDMLVRSDALAWFRTSSPRRGVPSSPRGPGGPVPPLPRY